MRFLLCFISFFLYSNFVYAFKLNVVLHHSNSEYVSGCNVLIWQKQSVISMESPDFKLKTNDKGELSVVLSKGEYYIMAEKKIKNKYLFGFYGLNPLKLNGDVAININLIEFDEKFIKKIGKNEINGFVTYKNRPVKDVDVFVYLDLSSELKGPPFYMSRTDEKGFFKINLEEGSYYLIFRKKDEPFGPPKSGDYVSFLPFFPVIIKKNLGYELKIELLKVTEKMQDSLKKLCKISGYVKDVKGSVLKGAYVVAYNRDELLGKPAYISSPVDEKGYFELFVKEGGIFYIVVRKTLGNTPDLKDFYVYGEIKVEEQEKEKNINIIANFDS